MTQATNLTAAITRATKAAERDAAKRKIEFQGLTALIVPVGTSFVIANTTKSGTLLVSVHVTPNNARLALYDLCVTRNWCAGPIRGTIEYAYRSSRYENPRPKAS